MAVRAKFKVTEIRLSGWGANAHLKTVKLTPVSSGSPENKEFYESTPCGAVEIGTLNAAAGDQFALGDEFYLDFTKADKPAE